MRRLLLALGLALATRANAQPLAPVDPIRMAACDMARSCHAATFTFDPDLTLNRYLVGLHVVSTYYERGGMLDCGGGCAWSTSPIPLFGTGLDDLFHGSINCYTVSPTPAASEPGLGRLCDIGTVDTWFMDFGAEPSYRPEWLDLNLLYQAQAGGPVLVSTLRLDASPFVTVPEPSTSALVGVGLAALLYMSRSHAKKRG